MKNNIEFTQRFLNETDESGRFIVVSKITGKTYFVEPIGDPHILWGDINTSTKCLEGNYGKKFKGSIEESESLITKENGFDNIILLSAGISPLSEIERLDKKFQENL